VLREAGMLTQMREHADLVERQLEHHPPDQATVTLTMTEDVFLRSSPRARWQLAIPLPVEG
jgi:hypothetical protein